MKFSLEHHRFPLSCLLALYIVALAAPLQAQATRRPNLVIVMADEWRYQATGYAGDANARTPSLDRFAAQSVNVRNAISGCSVCCPTRASLMTGQYPLRDGVYINDVPLRPTGTTLGEAFQRAGYATGYIGKWHLYGSPEGSNERRSAYIPPEYRFGFEYWKAAECCHTYNNSFYYEGDDPHMKYWKGYDAIAQTEDACAYLRTKATSGKPFFLMLSLGPPHFPTDQAPPSYQAMYRDRTIELRPNVPPGDRQRATTGLRGYYANIAAVDDCFGQLLRTLETTGLADDTVVVFMSDHGDMMYSQGLTFKLLPWEESVRVPFLIRYPRVLGRTGHVSDVLLNTPDIMPTLLSLCGLTIPEGVQGSDLSAQLGGREGGPSSAFISMPVSISTVRTDGIAEYRGVRTLDYTYIRSIHGPWLLYDNRAGPYQQHNLCGTPGAAEVQQHLEKELGGWLRKLDDRFLPGDSYLRRDHLENEVETQFPVGRKASPWGDWSSTLEKPASLSSASSIGDLMADAGARRALEHVFPQVAVNPILTGPFNFISLRVLPRLQASESLPQLRPVVAQLTKEKLDSLDREIANHAPDGK